MFPAAWIEHVVACCIGSAELLWRTPGKYVTIQCRLDTKEQITSLSVKMGLAEKDVFHVQRTTPQKPIVKDTFRGRLENSGIFPNLDILITNLTLNDTGPYWCFYTQYNVIKRQSETFKANGSVLLVVSGISASKTAFSSTRLLLGPYMCHASDYMSIKC